jgi:hypothetical protein
MSYGTILIIKVLAGFAVVVVTVTIAVTALFCRVRFLSRGFAITLGGLAIPATLVALGFWILHVGTLELDHDESQVYFGAFAFIALFTAPVSLTISMLTARRFWREFG